MSGPSDHKSGGGTIPIMVNGESQELPEGTTVAQLLERLNITPERVVVEHNMVILKRATHPTTVLQPHDVVEIVQFVGGGSTMLQASCYRLSGRGLPGAWSLQHAA